MINNGETTVDASLWHAYSASFSILMTNGKAIVLPLLQHGTLRAFCSQKKRIA